MDFVEISENVIHVERLTARVTSPTSGAISVFLEIIQCMKFLFFSEVPVCETSVAVVISSPHRKESLEAVQYGIDTLKATVPIWKKEIYEDDSYSWKENSECCGHK
ncbi:molybdopterin synthase catalytic subunit-like [Mercenaria mercenaria]|uniref:molybdopterin synthase catalytic subunit-like n=1 Tax=Mercenaria mercenaria TaxID=6596 RepID=UPI00234EA799|nr:molybdopterin synthase catalytic subunit-like [Mercenaria mercenaria]